MGDRGNVQVLQGHGDFVNLYSHWSGTELPAQVRTALAKNWRWDDAPYLTRIIFDVLTEGATGSEMGYGITANAVCDNEHDVLVVDCAQQEVLQYGAGEGRSGRSDEVVARWSFAEFVALTDDQLPET